jgi:DNA replication and repair protein RecF
MYIAQLQLADFRSYAQGHLELEPGISVFVGANGQGKTNLLEAVGYVATLSSHRVATDAPLVRKGAARAVLRAGVVDSQRRTLVELEINPGRANRARLNRVPVTKVRDVLGTLRTVLFAPEDLALVKGDPGERRRYLDELVTLLTPRYAGIRADYERVLKQRNALLRSASQLSGRSAPDLTTLDVWDGHLAQAGAELVSGRLRLVAQLRPLVAKAYEQLSPTGGATGMEYRNSAGEAADEPARQAEALRAALAENREEELRRGVSLVGPHRDDLLLSLNDLAVKGYASQGESWSFALALKLAAFELLRADGEDPVLILDDVFAELDAGRRRRLAEHAAHAQQVLVSAAVADDVPDELRGRRFTVAEGTVEP